MKTSKHEAVEEPMVFAGRKGIRCYCQLVHPVGDDGQMDTEHAINEIGCIVLVSEIDYIPIFEYERDKWTPYDSF